MIESRKKYVYKKEMLNNFFGMMPLHIYVSLCYFNHKEYKDIFMPFHVLTEWMTECLVAIITKKNVINPEDFDISAKDILISAFPSFTSHTYKCFAFNYNDSTIIVSELENESKPITDMIEFDQDKLLNLVLSCHNLSMSILKEIIDKCENSKTLIGVEEIDDSHDKKNNSENNDNKFDINNYQLVA